MPILAQPLVVPGDLLVKGQVYAEGGTKLNDGSIENRHVSSSAAIAAEKLEHQFLPIYSQPVDSTAVAEGKVVHVCRAAAEVVDVYVGLAVANIGDSTVTFDLKKNGVSILTAAKTVTSATTAYDVVAGVLAAAPTPLVAGDVLSVVVTISAGTGTLGKGPFAAVSVREAPGA